MVKPKGLWSRGMMLALGARGREFDSLKSPDGGGGGGVVWCGVVVWWWGGGGVVVWCVCADIRTSFILCLCSSVVRAVGC